MRHCVKWGSTQLPLKGHSPQFLADVYCSQTAGCNRIPHGTEVRPQPGDIVLDGHPAPPKRGTPANFRLISIVAKRLDGSRCHLVRRYSPRLMPHCVRREPSSPAEGAQQPLLFRPMSIVAVATVAHVSYC